jgi:hypothetical protein
MKATLKDPQQQFINMEPEKHQDWHWVSYDKIPEPMFFPLKQYCEEIGTDPTC